MIIAADEANSLCHAANGLSVVGLLRPFGVLAQLNGNIGGESAPTTLEYLPTGRQARRPAELAHNWRPPPPPPAVPVRTVGEAPFRLHSWRLRFYEGSAMFQPTPEVGGGRSAAPGGRRLPPLLALPQS